MRVLYGVNGEGMGHATRSYVVIESLLKEHDVRVVASGAAFNFLQDRLPRVDEILGPSFAMEEGEIRRWATVRQNLTVAPRELPDTVHHWMSVVDEWLPEVVITDFEPLAGIYARTSRTPLVCVDNIHMVDRCRHDREIIGDQRDEYLIAKAVTRAMVPDGGRLRRPHVLPPADLPRTHDAGAADRAPGDSERHARARRPPARVLER